MYPKFYTIEEAADACTQMNAKTYIKHTIKYRPVYCGGKFVNMYVIELE